METALVPTSQKKTSKSTSLLDENSPLLYFSSKLPAEVPDSLCGCSSSTIFGSHSAHTALQGAMGWDRIPSASVPADPAIPASCWAEMLPKRTLNLGGQIFAKDQAKAHLAPQFRSAVVFRGVVKHLHSYLPTHSHWKRHPEISPWIRGKPGPRQWTEMR